MKFNCERVVLLNGISIASRTAATKSTIPALEGLLVETGGDKLVITGYNLKTGVRTTVPADIVDEGKIVLNAKLFAEIIRKMPDGIVEVSVENSYLVKLTCSMSYFEIMGSSAEDFPELPTVDMTNSINVQEQTLKDMISQTIFAVSTTESRPVLTGSLFEIENGILTIVSVDGFRLALRREKIGEESLSESSFVVPGAALSEVEKIASNSEEMVTISLGTRHIMFSIGDTEIISRRLEGDFLDYKKSIPSVSKYKINADRKALIDVFERVSLIISEKYKSPVRCTFGDELLKISSVTALGKATDECAIVGSGDNLEIGFNNRYVLDALRAAPADELTVMLSSAVSPCLLIPADGSDGFVYILLPVRIRSDE